MRTKVFTIAAVLLAASALSGCGFTPMYAKPSVIKGLSGIDLYTPQTRTGYFLQQDLRQSMEDDPSTPKAYTLQVDMTEGHYAIGYRVDDTSTRSEITSNVNYTLTDKATGKVLTKDHFTETVTYASTASPFTGIVSQQAGQERLADAVSSRIQGALAVYFHEH
jgi:LPS-assembly lipoprotein